MGGLPARSRVGRSCTQPCLPQLSLDGAKWSPPACGSVDQGFRESHVVGLQQDPHTAEWDMVSFGSFGLDVGIYGALANPKTILQLAQHAEEAGFGSIWLADHVAFPVSFQSKYPYSAAGDFPTRLIDPLMEPVAT